MNSKELLEKLRGIQTIESVKDRLKVDKQKAIYYLYRLRKQGYVRTKRMGNNRRLYYISLKNRLGGKSYDEIINQYSPIKITSAVAYTVYGKEISLEETLIYALKTKSLRTILAALALFKKIDNWPLLYRLAKKEHFQRQVGALYDLARKIIKVRKMSKRFRSLSLPRKKDKYLEIIPKLSSDDFPEIEKIWKIHLPFNQKDMEDYR